MKQNSVQAELFPRASSENILADVAEAFALPQATKAERFYKAAQLAQARTNLGRAIKALS